MEIILKSDCDISKATPNNWPQNLTLALRFTTSSNNPVKNKTDIPTNRVSET